jgi:hypothetical protein
MLTPAIAVQEGMFPNRDFFSLYGPITPILQGIWLKFFGVSLLQLRLFSLTIVGLTAALMYFLSMKYISKSLSGVLVLSWLATGPTGLPWSSLILNLFYLLIIWLFTLAIRGENINYGRFIYFVAGFIVVTCLFVRVQMILTFLLLMVTIFFYDKRGLKYSLSFALGGLSSITIAFILLRQLKVWRPFFEQGIMWAGNFYGNPRIDRSYILNLLWFPLVSCVVLLLIRFSFPRAISLRLANSFWILLTIGFFVSSSYLSLQDRSSVRTLFSVRGIVLNGGWFLNHWLGLLVVSASTFMLAIALIRSRKKQQGFLDFFHSKNVIFIISITALSQLYPFYDLWHIWFITPVLIVGLLSLDNVRALVAQNSRRILSLCCIFILCSSVSTAFTSDRNMYAYSIGILRGMKSSDTNAVNLEETLYKLSQYGDSRYIKFDCPVGLYSVANSSYMANDLNYVNWGDFKDKDSRKANQLFVCEVPNSVIADYEEAGWKIVFKVEFIKKNYGSRVLSYNALLER